MSNDDHVMGVIEGTWRASAGEIALLAASLDKT